MPNNLKRLLMAAVLSVVLLGSVAAMADVKIGFLGGFTGPSKNLTPSMYKAAKLAINHVNKQGGVLDGQQIVLPYADTTCGEAAAAVAAGTKLVNEEKVVALVGGLCSGATISAAKDVGIPGGVTMVSPSATSPVISNLDDHDLVFRTVPSDVYQGNVMAHLLLSKGIKKIAITYVDNDYGKGLASALADNFTAAGGKIAANQGHVEGKDDYTPLINKLASSGVNTLVVIAYANGSGKTILRQAVSAGGFNQFVGGDAMVNNMLITAIGSDKLRGMIAIKPGRSESNGAREFTRLAWKESINPTATFAAQSYDAAFLLALAIEKNGKAERAGLSKALRDVASPPGVVILPGEWQKAKALIKAGKSINYEGAAGSLDFDPAGDVSGVFIEMGVNMREGSFIEFGQVQ